MKHAKKKASKLMPLWISLGAFFAVLILVYAVGVGFFNGHFGFKTSIDGRDQSYRTIEEVQEDIRDDVADYQFQIVGREGLDRTITAEQLGMVYASDSQLEQIMQEQNEWLWFTRLFTGQNDIELAPSVRLDDAKFNAVMTAADFFQPDRMRLPVNAQLVFEGNAYVIKPEDMGTLLDVERSKQAIYDCALVMASSVDLEAEGMYTPPEIFSDNTDLNATLETYNRYVPFCITYDFGDHVEILDGSVTMAWINIDEAGNGVLNEDAMKAWVREFGIRYDTIGTAREYTTVQGDVITVEGGDFGWEVDESAEIEAIRAAYTNHTGEVREPYYVQRGMLRAEPGKADWGNSYIELDLTDQHMYLVVEGQVTFEADVVTGLPYGRSATPPGVYQILEKLSPATLVGEIQSNGEPEYRTPVSFWMRMTWEGHGFHDATWQPWFGGDRYTYAGSHGCINMAYGNASTLYDLIEVGLPVISHH